jgi:SOS-response transcriptional repressor LexA
VRSPCEPAWHGHHGPTVLARRILRYIELFIERHGRVPTTRNIAGGVGLRSSAYVYSLLLGMLRRDIISIWLPFRRRRARRAHPAQGMVGRSSPRQRSCCSPAGCLPLS